MEITAPEPVEGGTKLTLDGEAEPGVFSKLAEPIVARGAQKQWETNVSSLKAGWKRSLRVAPDGSQQG